ncbi:Ig-like domain-containing protein, partial [uncultured Gimesia sp.]|uniref:Ig-like domain-containing protein n=1 Tax=uncultured Gimesia sp. TaxID=1678688 RepID=UPI00262A8A58
AVITYTYNVIDGLGGVVAQTATITINSVNDAPTVSAAVSTTATEDAAGFSLDLLTNASDVDNGAVLNISGLMNTGGDDSGITVNGNSLDIDPSAYNHLAVGESEVITYTYNVIDGLGGVVAQMATVTITGVNDPVVAADDDVMTDKNTPLVIDVRSDNGNGEDLDPDTNDDLTVTHISDASIATAPVFVETRFDLTSGAFLTLHADGTITYDPNGQFNHLTTPAQSETDTFTYTINDGHSSTDTATVTVTITGSNAILELSDPIMDFSSDGLMTEVIDLDNHFDDADAGDTVTYQVEDVKLVGGDSFVFPANFWSDNAFISGSDLNITFSAYASEQVRLPVEITVRATSSDGLSPDKLDTFILTPDPQTTAEIRLIARPTASTGRDFSGFRAENPGSGAGTFMLTNGMQELNYSLFLGDFSLDLDGTDNGDPNDDLKAVRIIDTANGNAVLFTLFHSSMPDDDPTVDSIKDILAGTLTTGEGLTGSIIDKLYNEELAIELEQGSGFKSILSGGNILSSPEVDELNNLPTSTTQAVLGQEYVVEIWLSDQLAEVLAGQTTELTDVTSILFDLLWDDTTASFGISGSVTGGASAFSQTQLPTSGAPGELTGFGGVTFTPGFADGSYARVGYATFRADGLASDVDPVEYTIDANASDLVLTRGQSIDLSQISLVGASVTHIAPSEFFIQTDQSSISVTGTIDVGSGVILNLDPQSVGLDSTSLSGRLDIVVDDFNNPTTIQIVDSTVEVNPAGEARPERDATGTFNDSDLADFGLKGRQLIPGSDGLLSMAIRDSIATVFSSEQALSMGGLFDITEDWTLDNGQIDSIVTLPNEFVINDSSDVANDLTMTYFDPMIAAPAGLSSWNQAKLTETSMGSGIFELIVPVSRTMSFTTSGGEDVVLNFVGSVTSMFNTNQSDQFGETIATAESTGLTSAAPGTEVYQGIIGNNSVIADPLSDVDMFQVQLNAGDTVIVDVDADMFETGLDSVVRIFDEDGNRVAYSDDHQAPDEFLFDSGDLDSYVEFTALTTGNYYIGLSAWNFDLDDPSTPIDYDPEDAAGRPTGVDESGVGSYDLTITVTDAIAPPLHGTVSADVEEPLTDGTAVDLIVVRNQTEVDSLGRLDALPRSDTWIDEWSSFWVEVYVETADAKGITDAIVDLNYNTDFFTATAIEFGAQFAGTGNAVIDDATGVVTSINGIANGEKAGNAKKALLARVKFESLEQDDVSINFEDKFIGPHALGLSLSNVSISLTDDAVTNVIVGDAPETDLWAIAYDVNDDDTINFRDLMILASVYGQNVLDTNSPYVWALDADKSGSVNFKDLSYFATNYGVSKGGDREVVYPANFLQRWYGKTTNISGDSSIDEVMDVALGMWQDALGLEQPLDVQLVITDLGGTQLGEGQITAVDEQGRPIAGIVTLDDDAAGLGWYSDIDTTAFGGSDLEGGVAYTADGNSDAAGHYDLLTVLLHEIGHVAGFTETYAPFQSHVESGVGGTLSFVGSGFEATLTNDGLHLDETVHAGDVMNATLDPGVRKLPSILDALILQAAHESAASGNFEILVGVNAPLMANLPAKLESEATSTSNVSRRGTLLESVATLEPSVVTISNSLTELNESSLPQINLTLNHLNLNSLELGQDELDLTVLEDFSDELLSDLRLNGLAIVDSGETSGFEETSLNETDLDLTGFSEQLDAGFDDVFSDWAGPIL